MKPWEKYAEAEAKPWEKYATAPLSVKADPIGEQADRDYDAVLGRIGVIDRGATFGLGRKVGGLINAIGSYPIDRIAQLSGVENTPGFWDRYHETVDPTMQAMERYQEEHPVEAFALEMAGGIANPANKVGAGWIGKGGNAATRVLRSGVVGTGAGGVAGAMNTENVENLRDNTIIGSVFGFGLGVTLPVAIGAITKGVGLLRSNTKKGLDYMRRELGDEAVNAMIREAEETGRPIIEVANDKALKLGQAARMQTPEAMDTIDAAAERFKNTMSDRNSAFIDDNLGSLSRFDSLEAVENEARKQAQPFYDKLQNVGDLAEVEAKNLATSSDTFKPISGVSDNNNIPSLATYVKENPFLQQEIGKIRKNPLFQTEYNMSELPDTDWRILDQVNKNINDQISTAVRNGENETVRLLERQKYDLLNKVDEIVPEYKQARALYEDARRFKKAANTAEQIFKGDVSKEAFAKTFDSMSKTERDALKIGLRDEIYKIIGNRENEALGWKKVVPAQVQDKIRKVLGVEEGNKLIKYANDEIKAMRNYNKATQGSKTAEKTDLEKAINWRRELLDFASLGSVRGRNKGIANIMTNPNAGEVASAFDQLSNPSWGGAVYQRYLGYTPEMIALGNYLANKR